MKKAIALVSWSLFLASFTASAVDPVLLRTFESDEVRDPSPMNFPYFFGNPLVFHAPDGAERVVIPSTGGTIYYVDPVSAIKLFKLEILEPVYGSPAILDPASNDPTIIIGSESGKMYILDSEARIRLDPVTGAPYVYRVDGGIIASPVVTPSQEILIATLTGDLYFFNARAEVLERVQTGKRIVATPLIVRDSTGEDLALVGTEEGDLLVISLVRRSLIATYSVRGPVRATPATLQTPQGQTLWVVVTQNGYLSFLNERGEVQSEIRIQEHADLSAELIHTSFAKSSQGKLILATLRTLAEIHPDQSIQWWNGETPAFMNPGFHSSGALIVGSDTRGLRFRNPDLSPSSRWPGSGGDPFTLVTFQEDRWFFGQEAWGNGVMYYFEPVGGELLARSFAYPLGAYSAPVELADGTMLVARVDGKILFFMIQ